MRTFLFGKYGLVWAVLLACSLLGCAQHPSVETTPEGLPSAATAGLAADANQTPAAKTPKPYPSQPSNARACERLCEPAFKLGCQRAEACKLNCMNTSSIPVCQVELQAFFFRCLATQPDKHWECLEDGSVAIKQGFCEQEQAAFAACLQRNQSQ